MNVFQCVVFGETEPKSKEFDLDSAFRWWTKHFHANQFEPSHTDKGIWTVKSAGRIVGMIRLRKVNIRPLAYMKKEEEIACSFT